MDESEVQEGGQVCRGRFGSCQHRDGTSTGMDETAQFKRVVCISAKCYEDRLGMGRLLGWGLTSWSSVTWERIVSLEMLDKKPDFREARKNRRGGSGEVKSRTHLEI